MFLAAEPLSASPGLTSRWLGPLAHLDPQLWLQRPQRSCFAFHVDLTDAGAVHRVTPNDAASLDQNGFRQLSLHFSSSWPELLLLVQRLFTTAVRSAIKPMREGRKTQDHAL